MEGNCALVRRGIMTALWPLPLPRDGYGRTAIRIGPSLFGGRKCTPTAFTGMNWPAAGLAYGKMNFRTGISWPLSTALRTCYTKDPLSEILPFGSR